MKNIVLFGAGKSATYLIDYLLKETLLNSWKLTVCDSNLTLAQSKIGNAVNAKAVSILVQNDIERNALIQQADLVISLLPPELHFIVAKDCVGFNKNLLTASYVDENIKSLAKEIDSKKLLFLCEMGLDPGIDHMSAMKIIESLKKKNANITSFISHCGGLIAPESDNNPWHYKVTWNPRNIILAGKDGAVYRKENKTIKVPYQKIFKDCVSVDIPGLHKLAWYPNRDSLSYIPLYKLDEIPTFIRTTLRHASFCRGWHKLLGIGCTSANDFEQIKHCKTFEEWFTAKVSPFVDDKKNWNNYLQIYITDPYRQEFSSQIDFLGFHSGQNLPTGFTCSADILQYCLESKLGMNNNDMDMIVMLHEVEYNVNGQRLTVNSSLIVKGIDSLRTAMAKTVGLPLGIAAKLILRQKIKLTGLHIPIIPEIYEPVLSEMEQHGIRFNETDQSI
ncbi:MAG: saccharopine dehydrogenase C-terminal domain-containing protein [Ginsengibacter sp.]